MCVAIIERNFSKNGRSKMETIGDYLQVMLSFVETDSQQKRVRGIHDQSGVFTRKLLFSDVLFKTMHQIRFCLRLNRQQSAHRSEPERGCRCCFAAPLPSELVMPRAHCSLKHHASGEWSWWGGSKSALMGTTSKRHRRY